VSTVPKCQVLLAAGVYQLQSCFDHWANQGLHDVDSLDAELVMSMTLPRMCSDVCHVLHMRTGLSSSSHWHHAHPYLPTAASSSMKTQKLSAPCLKQRGLSQCHLLQQQQQHVQTIKSRHRLLASLLAAECLLVQAAKAQVSVLQGQAGLSRSRANLSSSSSQRQQLEHTPNRKQQHGQQQKQRPRRNPTSMFADFFLKHTILPRARCLHTGVHMLFLVSVPRTIPTEPFVLLLLFFTPDQALGEEGWPL
jgi:hypothetical protein